ncbi:hypothetical protein BU16DRAFT_534536 [Lophium mytilinum]|uniref:RING-type domain-containing protein n=1 Tax=Lophium mytilinum TaxID=390894 RepID=A0A6A6RBH9_9PEZI|nr:hypothetical protein BU16DRAFT_534536 [Lophium mytilinum]
MAAARANNWSLVAAARAANGTYELLLPPYILDIFSKHDTNPWKDLENLMRTMKQRGLTYDQVLSRWSNLLDCDLTAEDHQFWEKHMDVQDIMKRAERKRERYYTLYEKERTPENWAPMTRAHLDLLQMKVRYVRIKAGFPSWDSTPAAMTQAGLRLDIIPPATFRERYKSTVNYLRAAKQAIAEVDSVIVPYNPANDEEDPSTQCQICDLEYSDVRPAMQFPCHHVYCRPCIQKWLIEAAGNRSCPACRRDLIPPRSATRPSIKLQRIPAFEQILLDLKSWADELQGLFESSWGYVWEVDLGFQNLRAVMEKENETLL